MKADFWGCTFKNQYLLMVLCRGLAWLFYVIGKFVKAKTQADKIILFLARKDAEKTGQVMGKKVNDLAVVT